MAIPNKNLRKIVVADETYRWTISPDDGFIVFVAEFEELSGRRLEVYIHSNLKIIKTKDAGELLTKEEGNEMFSILVEDVFEISSRMGITIIGKTSGVINIGDYLIDANNKTCNYKVIGIEMVHYSNIEKRLNNNPVIMIESGDYKPSDLKGKTLRLQ